MLHPKLPLLPETVGPNSDPVQMVINCHEIAIDLVNELAEMLGCPLTDHPRLEAPGDFLPNDPSELPTPFQDPAMRNVLEQMIAGAEG